MTAYQARNAAHWDGPVTTSFDETGAGGGYDLADRFDALKATLRMTDRRPQRYVYAVRSAVAPARTRRGRRAKRRFDASHRALQSAAGKR